MGRLFILLLFFVIPGSHGSSVIVLFERYVSYMFDIME